MAHRNHESDSAKIVDAKSQSETPRVYLTAPTDDEEQHLRSIEKSNSEYDPAIIVGGPRSVRS
ncbi:hypothetical protein BST63_33260 [Bradyrhizobium canariense]|uniref:Uncharacterized protein n=1 Tax=Bradyrhizobium canariense TaxID=255045 RepID=A0A1X3GFL1_9BRAD|nr:hypothetical protein BSZ22_14860 [Bradyrhizobium canariense]OSI75299.1 hypothetical protein BSZ23_29290 [Bradyrhizobium canariense]OSI85828.1 hypothetical protein BSZ25_31510 [Bradyrhizobium canariense]OSI88207.1 hypothetical protein BSZ24_24870 [Bradyrhizobium canariense]OSI99032.1 hypothetical protein BSZ16_30720 [Bradyrhizobium canariense]